MMTQAKQPPVKPRPWSQRIRRPIIAFISILLIGVINSWLNEYLFPPVYDASCTLNDTVITHLDTIYPWHLLSAYLREVSSVTELWPQDAGVIYQLSSLVGRMMGALVTVPMTILAEGNAMAYVALAGYGLGIYIVYILLEVYRGDDPNLLIVGLGGIVVGGVCLWLLKPIMQLMTGLFGSLFCPAGLVAGIGISTSFALLVGGVLKDKLSEFIAERMVDPLVKPLSGEEKEES